MFLRVFTSFAVAWMATTALTQETARADEVRTKSVAIDNHVLAGGKEVFIQPPQPRYEVARINGTNVVVVKYWNEYQEKMVAGSTVALDQNNQFQPTGMRWKFTLTPDGYLTWEEVKPD